ncbi:MAG: hypothetical protein IH984_15055 [Planctomycetes bacterium]|nr:hypothetical protein [Planctomycetota bacterium]
MMARVEAEIQTTVHPYFKHLPSWIYAHLAYASRVQCVAESLTNAEWWVLHIIAGQCSIKADDSESTRGCWCGVKLLLRTHCTRNTFWEMMKKFYRLGFVMKLTQGGGNGKANELGIPGLAGALDTLSVHEDPRYRMPRRTVQDSDGKPSKLQTVNRPGSESEPSRIRTQISSSSSNYQEDYLCADGDTVTPTANGCDHDCQEQEPFELHDDELELRASELRKELPDSTDPDQIKRMLKDAGEDPGRAHKHAHHAMTTPAMARQALAMLSMQVPRNPGAYLGSLMDDLIDKAKEVDSFRKQQESEAGRRCVQEADELFDAMPDAELKELIESTPCTKGMEVNNLRNDTAMRKHLTEVMAARLDIES